MAWQCHPETITFQKDKNIVERFFPALQTLQNHPRLLDSLKSPVIDYLTNAGFKIDYLEFVDANDLSPATKNRKLLLLLL